MGRDASSDRGGDQAVWQDLVARLELPQVTDPAGAPWPDRENLSPAEPAKTTQSTDRRAPGSGSDEPGSGDEYDLPISRRRVIRPATYLRLGQDTARPAGGEDSRCKDGMTSGLDFQDLADLEFDDEDSDRYVPPEIPPQPRMDPVAKGAWTALFGGPGYLFLATTLSWHVPGWAELAAIIAFVAGFVILVFRLGDGPSRKDGPDQGAVV